MTVEKLDFKRTDTRTIEWEATTAKGKLYFVKRLLPDSKYTAFTPQEGSIKKIGRCFTAELAFEYCQKHYNESQINT